MKLREIISAISTPDGLGVDYEKVLDMEVEFDTASRHGLTLLSVYEYGGKILIDIGTAEDTT